MPLLNSQDDLQNSDAGYTGFFDSRSKIILDKNKSSPLYFQIYEDISYKVEKNILKAGDRLPTEQRLVEFYGVSRVTIRKALEELILDGIIKREHSKGAVVSSQKPKRNFLKLTSLQSEIINSGMRPSSVISGIQRVAARGTIAANLKVEEGEPLINFHRLRLGNGIPIAVQEVYIREKYCRISDIKNLGDNSLFDTLEQKYGLVIDYADQVLSAKIPTKKQHQELNMTEESALLFMKRTTYLSTGDTLEYAENFYVANRYEWSARSYREQKTTT